MNPECRYCGRLANISPDLKEYAGGCELGLVSDSCDKFVLAECFQGKDPRVARLRPGAIIVDLVAGGIYGDLDHCPKEDLLESAEALLSLLPKVQHRGLWGLGKAYDSDCYLYTAAKKYQLTEGITLPTNIDKGPVVGDPEALRCIPDRPFTLRVFDSSSREDFWRHEPWYRRVGSVKDGHASPDIAGVPERYREPEYTPIQPTTGRTAVSKKAAKEEPELVQQKLF